MGICLAAGAQTSAPSPAAQNGAEVSSETVPFRFQTKVNLVLVPVVVRGRDGKAIGTLRKDDFELFDRGRRQEILQFSIEHAAGAPGAPAGFLSGLPAAAAKPVATGIAAPNRFVVYLFDDIHGSTGDLIQARNAAEKHLRASLRPLDRAAIYTSSGSLAQDFTDDLAKLHGALLTLRPHRSEVAECPDINYYMADLIRNQHDRDATNLAISEAVECMHLQSAAAAQAVVENAAARVLALGDEDTRQTLAAVDAAVRKLSLAPGTRVLALASPGFLRLNDKLRDEAAVLERAVRNNVVIGTVDPRGLATEIVDASKPGYNSRVFQERQKYERWSRMAESEVLSEVAAATGGSFTHNNNDLEAGFNHAAAAPDVWYVLGFSPQNLKADGAFHGLKVALPKAKGLTVEARHGYYAPTRLESAEEQARQEISEAIFSHEEVQEMPLAVHTEFFKTGEAKATLSVLSNVDVRRLRYRKEGERNLDVLRLAVTLFDRNGNFVDGASRRLEMRLRDETLERRLDSGIMVKTEFQAAPGGYLIRVVVRDDEGQTMAARNAAVEIP